MRRSLLTFTFLSLTVALAACGGGSFNTASINTPVMRDRIVETLGKFDAYMRRYEYKTVNQTIFDQFIKTIQHDLNAKPRIHNTKIVAKWRENGAIIGYGDLNKNGKVEDKEPLLFKLEFDPDNDRAIVTSFASRRAHGKTMRGSGFFTGVFMAAIVARQVASGMKYGDFNKRVVADAPIGEKVAASDKKSKKGK